MCQDFNAHIFCGKIVKNKKSDCVVADHSSTDLLGFCLFFPSLIPNYSFFFSRLLILFQ